MTNKTTVAGLVEKVWENQTKAGITYSIVVNNTKYGTYTTKPSCKQGDNVTFQATQNGNYWNADVKTIKLAGPTGGPVAPPAATGKAPWVPDKERQDSITYQSARKDALEFLKLMQAGELLDLGKGKTIGTRLAVLETTLDMYTERFFQDTKVLGHKEKAGTDDVPFDDSLDTINTGGSTPY